MQVTLNHEQNLCKTFPPPQAALRGAPSNRSSPGGQPPGQGNTGRPINAQPTSLAQGGMLPMHNGYGGVAHEALKLLLQHAGRQSEQWQHLMLGLQRIEGQLGQRQQQQQQQQQVCPDEMQNHQHLLAQPQLQSHDRSSLGKPFQQQSQQQCKEPVLSPKVVGQEPLPLPARHQHGPLAGSTVAVEGGPAGYVSLKLVPQGRWERAGAFDRAFVDCVKGLDFHTTGRKFQQESRSWVVRTHTVPLVLEHLSRGGYNIVDLRAGSQVGLTAKPQGWPGGN